MAFAWAVALIAAATPAHQSLTLAGLHLGETVDEARGQIASEHFSMRPLQQFKRLQTYLLYNSSNEIFGNVGICDGRVWSVGTSLDDRDAFNALLRDNLAKYGQPAISFRSIPSSDSSTLFERIVYRWADMRYEISISARDNQLLVPEQNMLASPTCE